MKSDLLGYLALAAVAAGALYYRRRARAGTGPDHSSRGEHGDQADTASGGSTPAPLALPPPPPRPRPRPLDVVTVRCEHLDHQPGHVPTLALTRADISRDMNTLRRQGWGGSSHTNLCHYHNPAGQLDLNVIHVLCETPGCGERERIRATGSIDAEFGRLRNKGWVNNHDNTIACPYCTGTRRRPRW